MKKTHSLILSIVMLFAVFLTASCERVTASELAIDKGKPVVAEAAASADRVVEMGVHEDLSLTDIVRIRAVCSASPAFPKLRQPAFVVSTYDYRTTERPREPDLVTNDPPFRGIGTNHFARADI